MNYHIKCIKSRVFLECFVFYITVSSACISYGAYILIQLRRLSEEAFNCISNLFNFHILVLTNTTLKNVSVKLKL